MKIHYSLKNFTLVVASVLLLSLASCKKESSSSKTATPTKLGLYEFSDDIYKQLQIVVSKVGTQSVNYGSVFDTGSGGMVIDASGILPTTMITSRGFNFTGDSTIVDGITITSQTDSIQYGNNNDLSTVYGNLAYAPVTLGDQNGSVVIKRLPFFLYYKATNSKGVSYPAHEFDVMGVSPQYNLTFNNGAYITSPFSYFDPGTGLTKGMKIAALGTSGFSYNGTYVPNVVTLGLTSADLSTSSGFVMSQLSFYSGNGYLPFLQTAVTYGTKTATSYILFDTGTSGYSYILDKTSGSKNLIQLAANTPVKLDVNSGFSYTYTTTDSQFLTYIENPTYTGDQFSILSIDFFLNNEYLVDYANHKLGLKNN